MFYKLLLLLSVVYIAQAELPIDGPEKCSDPNIGRLSQQQRETIMKQISKGTNLREENYDCLEEAEAFLFLREKVPMQKDESYYKIEKQGSVFLKYGESCDGIKLKELAKNAARWWKSELKKMSTKTEFGCDFKKTRGKYGRNAKCKFMIACIFENKAN